MLGGKDEFDKGRESGLAGHAKPSSSEIELSGWRMGNARRRVLAGEAIGFVSTGTKCDSCGEQNWGYRLGCRCNTSLDQRTVRYGLLVNDGLAEGECAKFMMLEEVQATGKPLIDYCSGDDVPLDA